MALVDYSSSGESDEPIATVEKTAIKAKGSKRKRSVLDSELPPLPDLFHDLYATNVRVGTHDDPALHGGRKRVIPHVEGNWPSHIYIEWYPSHAELAKLSNLISLVETYASEKPGQVHTFLESELGAQLPLHVSLSRSMMLLTHQRQPFVDLLEKAVNKSGIRPFDLTCKGLAWVPNFEKTRWFLVLQLAQPGKDELNKLLQLCNQVAKAFDQPTLYAVAEYSNVSLKSTKRGRESRETERSKKEDLDDSRQACKDFSNKFHISIAWRLDPPPPAITEYLKSLDMKSLREMQVVVKAVKIKVGNSVHTFPLLSKPEEV